MAEEMSEKPQREVRMQEDASNTTHSQLEAATTRATDTEKGSTGYAASELGVDHRKGISTAERKLLWKLDRVIIPLTALLYLSAYLDRGNLGNARLQGLEAGPLGGSDDRYSLALAAFFITYIVFSIPGTLLAKAILPCTSIGLGAIIWSIAATSMAGATNFGGVVTCRLFVGIGEALFGQAVTLHYSLWYRKNEISKRLAIFIGAGALSGAFGGLIAYGVAEITNPSISSWRILFLIEGLPSFCLAVAVLFCLPSRPDKSRYIDENERTLIHTRLNKDSLGEGHTGIDIGGVKRAFMFPLTYVVAIIYSAMNLTLGSVSGYLPTLIKGLGYSNADAQLYTVPPYAVAFVLMILLSTISDRWRTRGIPAAVVFTISAIGWLILLTVHDNLHARYFATFCITSGGYCAIPLLMSWQSNNSGSQSQRAVMLGMLNTVGQCLSVLAAYLFPSSEGPYYTRGVSVNLAFACLAIILCLSTTAYLRWENRRRDRVEGPPPPVGTVLDVITMHDLAPGFRYTV